MFGIIRRIRGWLERKFRRSLGMLKDGFLVINEGEGTALSLQKCTLEVERYFLGLFPVFRIRQEDVITAAESIRSLDSLRQGFLAVNEDPTEGAVLKKCTVEVERYLGGILPVFRVREHHSLSLSEVVSKPIQASQAAFIQELENTPATAVLQTEGYLANSAKQRIGRAKTKTAEEAEKRFKEFDAQVLATLIKKDRNTFRQLLLEQLSRTAADTFTNMIKKHLAELVLRTREECLQGGLIDEGGETGSEQLALPTGTRFFHRKGKMTLFVIEQSPMKRTIQTIAQAGSPVERYELSFPFVVFFVVLRNRKFDKLYVLFRTEPLRTVEDTLLCPSLSNIFDDFGVCFGTGGGPATAQHLAETAEASLENFWGGRFNLSHAANYFRQISLEDWQKKSQKDSLFGLAYRWRLANQTVASMMEHISKEFKADEKKKKTGSGVNLSTLEKCVDRLATTVAKEIQEACFFLVPKWSIEEATLQDVITRFKQAIEDMCLLLKTELEDDIEGVLSERNLKRAFQKAIERTVESVKAGSDNSVTVARQALLNIIAEEIHDPGSH